MKKIQGLVIVVISLLTSICFVPVNPSVASAASSDVTVTLNNSFSAMDVEYTGGNLGVAKDWRDGNMGKYLGDSMYDLGRIFPTFEFTNDTVYGDGVTDAASYATAKDTVKANPLTNTYINWEIMQRGLLNPDEKGTMHNDLGVSLLEMNRLGVEPLVVVRPQDTFNIPQWPSRSYEGLWEWWENCFAFAYLLSKNYGVTEFNLINEPDHSHKQWDMPEYLDILKEGADAVRAGAAAAGKTARIWGPTLVKEKASWGDYVMDHADDVVDVYDYHTYTTSVNTIANDLNAVKSRIQTYNSDGITEPISISEWNSALDTYMSTETHDLMSYAITNVRLLKSMVDNGVIAPLQFRFTRGGILGGNHPASAKFNNGLIRIDDSTKLLTSPTKAYYALRMANRVIRSPRDKVDYTASGSTAGLDFMATRSDDSYYVLFINRSSSDTHNYTVDFSNLGITNAVATVRETSNLKNDEVIGTYAISNGVVTVNDLPAESCVLFVVPRNSNTPAAPVIHRGFSDAQGIELWWKNSEGVSSYKVKRKAAGGSYMTVADSVYSSFYRDIEVSPGTNYYYKISAVNGNGEGADSVEAGPFQLENNDYFLPYMSNFEDTSDAGWTKESGAWSVRKVDDDYVYHSSSESGSTNIATVGSSDWGNYSVSAKTEVERIGEDGKFGLITRYSDSNNYYKFEYDRTTNKVSIIKNSAGIFTTLASESPGIDISPLKYRYMLNAVLDGGDLHFFINYKHVLTATDNSPLTSGKVGFVVQDSAEINFDGVKVVPTFKDDFQTTERSDWQEQGGAWSVTGTGDKWYQQSDSTGSGYLKSINGSAHWRDYSIELKIRPDELTAQNAAIAVFSRYIDDSNYYSYELNTTDGVVINKKVDGNETILATEPYSITVGDIYTVHIEIAKNAHSVYINGNLIVQADSYEPLLESGKFAIGTNSAKAGFDEVAVNHLLREATPVLNRVTSAGNGTATVAFSEVEGASSYNIRYGIDYYGEYTNTITGITGSPYTISGLNEGSTYYFSISSNHESGTSLYSEPKAITINNQYLRDDFASKSLSNWTPVSGSWSIGKDGAFRDDFESGDALKWTEEAGTWSVVTDGATRMYYQSDDIGSSRAIAGDSSWDNYTVELNVKPDAFSSSGSFGINFRYVDANNKYYVTYTKSNQTLHLKKMVSGSSTTLDSANITLNAGMVYAFKIVADGSRFDVFVNGAHMLSSSGDTTFTMGKICLSTYDSKIKFDDINVSPTVYLNDDFESGSTYKWYTEGGEWSVVTDGSNVVKQASSGGGRLTIGNGTWKDVEVEAKLKADSVTTGIGISFKYKNNNNHYYVNYKKINDTINIISKVNGKDTILASKSFVLSTDTWYTWKIASVGNEIKFYINGVEELTAVDTVQAYAVGKVSLHMNTAVAAFDDVKIKLIDTNETSYNVSQLNSSGGRLTGGNPEWNDYSVSAGIRPLSYGMASGRVGLGFGYRDENNYYKALYDNGTGKLYLEKVENGTTTILAEKAFDKIYLEKQHELSVVVLGNLIGLYVDGIKYLSAADTDLISPGKIALETQNAKATFYDVRVKPSAVLVDDFEDNDANGWNATQGNWSIVTDGTKVYRQTNGSGGKTNIGDGRWTDYSVEAKVKAISFDANGGSIGLGFRHQDDVNRYFVKYVSSTGEIAISKNVNNSETLLASKSYPIIADTEYTFKVVAKGSQIDFYINGVKELSATDTTFKNGKISLSMWNAIGQFDEISVKPIQLLTDDFEDGDASDWTDQNGTWSVISDDTKVFRQSGSSGGSVSHTSGQTWTDYSVEANAKLLSVDTANGGTIAIGFRFQDISNGYFLTYSSIDDRLRIIKRENGSEVTLGFYNGLKIIGMNEIFTIKAVVQGNKIEAYVNGQKKITTMDETFAEGGIALEMYNATGEYDDVAVRSIY